MAAEDPFRAGWLAALFLIGWFLFADFVVLQMFIAVINEVSQLQDRPNGC